MKRHSVLFASIIFVLSSSQAIVRAENFEIVRKNTPVERLFPIKCTATHYTWTGMLAEGPVEHRIKVVKDQNSRPLDVVILEKGDKLMVDNEEFTIGRSNAKETFAVFIDEKNIITVLLNYRYGTLLYNKVFTNVDFGKQNAMSFVGVCENY